MLGGGIGSRRAGWCPRGLLGEQPELPRGAAALVADEIVRDGYQPAGRLIRHRPSLVQAHERLLRGVGGQLGVAGESVQVGEQGGEARRVTGPERLLEGGLGSRAGGSVWPPAATGGVEAHRSEGEGRPVGMHVVGTCERPGM